MPTYSRVLVEIPYIYCPALPVLRLLSVLSALPVLRFPDLFEPEDRRIKPEKKILNNL